MSIPWWRRVCPWTTNSDRTAWRKDGKTRATPEFFCLLRVAATRDIAFVAVWWYLECRARANERVRKDDICGGGGVKLAETTVEKRYVYEGKILRVRCDKARLPDGKPCVREMVEHPGGAAVLAECDGKIAFVRQFRYPYGEEILEVPAGKLEKGEAPVRTVQRELSEETGLVADRFVPLGEIYPTPGYTDERLYLFRAEGVRRGESHPDEGEFLSLEWYSPCEALAMVRDGRIKDAKTVVLLLRCYG